MCIAVWLVGLPKLGRLRFVAVQQDGSVHYLYAELVVLPKIGRLVFFCIAAGWQVLFLFLLCTTHVQ